MMSSGVLRTRRGSIKAQASFGLDIEIWVADKVPPCKGGAWSSERELDVSRETSKYGYLDTSQALWLSGARKRWKAVACAACGLACKVELGGN